MGSMSVGHVGESTALGEGCAGIREPWLLEQNKRRKRRRGWKCRSSIVQLGCTSMQCLIKKKSYATEENWNPIKTWLHCTQSIRAENLYLFFHSCSLSKQLPHTPLPQWDVQKLQEKLLFVCSVVLTRHVMLITDTYFVFDSCFLFWVSLRKAWRPSKAHWPLSISSCQFRSPPLYAQASVWGNEMKRGGGCWRESEI